MSRKPEDVFDVVSGELTALRRSVENLSRTSLSKTEAADLSKNLVQAVDRMERAVQSAPQALQETLKADRDRMARDAAQAAREAAERVMVEIRGQLKAERLHFAQSAGEARRAVWRSFGGFWVWLLSMFATGALTGALAAYGIETAKSVLSVEQEVRIGCGRSWGSGQVVDQEDGSSFCAHWLVTPSEAARAASED